MSKKSLLYRDSSKDIITITAIEDGGFKTECKGENGLEWGGIYYGLVTYESLQNLQGKMLTIIDASISDQEQRKAIKDIVNRTIWFDWVENHIYKGKNVLSTGMPTA